MRKNQRRISFEDREGDTLNAEIANHESGLCIYAKEAGVERGVFLTLEQADKFASDLLLLIENAKRLREKTPVNTGVGGYTL